MWAFRYDALDLQLHHLGQLSDTSHLYMCVCISDVIETSLQTTKLVH